MSNFFYALGRCVMCVRRQYTLDVPASERGKMRRHISCAKAFSSLRADVFVKP